MATVKSLLTNALSYSGLRPPADVSAEFMYRFYTPDETVSEQTGNEPGASARYVKVNFTQGESYATSSIKISDIDITKVHTIEDIVNMRCTYITSQNTGIFNRTSDAIQRSCRMRGITGNSTDKAEKLGRTLSPAVNREILQDLAVNSDRSGLTQFANGSVISDISKYDDVTGVPARGNFYDKFIGDICQNAEMQSPYRAPVELGLIAKYLLDRQREERNIAPNISAGDFTSFLEPIATEESTSADFGYKLIGYLIDRVEEFSSGKREIRTIGRSSQTNLSFVDYEIKYGARYSYTVRTIFEATLPQIITGRADPIVSTVLISSAPSNIASVVAEELVPPPPPTDVSFSFDHTRGELVIRWEFPVNPQQDVTRFQLFRRRSIAESFILLKEFDFDRSSSPVIRSDAPLPINIIKSNFPVRRFIDHDFGRSSDYIYALCSVDAHGLVSNYSTQFRVTFNRRLNTIIVKSISSSGAPRSYPNLYLNNPDSLTLDSISGRGPTRMRIVFDPEYHDVTASGFNLELLKFIENDAKYFVNVIDTDRAEQVSVPISIISGSI